MTEEKWAEEPEEFGLRPAWMLINRHDVGGVRTSVNVLPVQGRGVLFQTVRETCEDTHFDEPVLVDDVMVMEYVTSEPSKVTDEAGRPVSVTRRVTGREIVAVDFAVNRFQSGKEGRDKRRERLARDFRSAKTDEAKKAINAQMAELAAQGPQDHLMIIAGTCLTMEQAAPGTGPNGAG